MKILIIEDEREIADGIKAILSTKGFESDIVCDGDLGLSYSLSNTYDLILLDVMLPGMSGLDILKKTRSEGINTPVILLTARSLTEDKVKGLDLGADDYLTKPFDSEELLARIRARLRDRYDLNNEKNSITAYDIELNTSTYKLICGDKSVKLSNKEFQLLEYLMINKGIILTRDMISTKVWGFDDETEYNNADVYISFIRKKLRFVGAKASILTKKGIGYSLEEKN